MNNFLAYLIGNELIEKHENRLEILIRLDSYQHWLDDQKPDEKGKKKYPDFLLIEADIKNDQPLHIDATIIEAKIAKATNMLAEHLPKAQKQIKQGLEVLSRHFDPESKSIERRYWLAQLYRALAFLQAEINFTDSAFPLLQEKMNELIEGQFSIDWHGRILACEIDREGLIDHLPLNDEGIEVDCWLVGQNAMQNILLGQAIDTVVAFDSEAQAEDEDTESDDGFYDDFPDEPSDSFLIPADEKHVVVASSVDNNPDEPAIVNTPDEPAIVNTVGASDNEDGKLSNDDKIDPVASEADNPIEQDSVVEHTGSAMDIEDIRLLIGQDRSKRSVFWEFGHKQLANRHLLITGGSGQGKTYAIQTLLFELAKQDISSVVFDYTDGFLPGKLEPPFESALGDKIQQHYAIAGQLPINPFKRQPLMIPGLPEGILEQSTNVASRFAAIMKHVYSFGEQQTSALYDACKKGITNYLRLIIFIAKNKMIL